MTIVAADIRAWPLNNIPESDMSDDVITAAAEMAAAYVDDVQKEDATTSQIDNAVRAYGGYLAFLAYLDHPVEDVAGSFTNGYFTPATGSEGVPQIRSMHDIKTKLKHLKETAENFLGLVSSTTNEGIWPIKPRVIPYMTRTTRQKEL